ncbi:MAG: hypothetical protein WD715_15840 [Dongiaceae bacterium]
MVSLSNHEGRGTDRRTIGLILRRAQDEGALFPLSYPAISSLVIAGLDPAIHGWVDLRFDGVASRIGTVDARVKPGHDNGIGAGAKTALMVSPSNQEGGGDDRPAISLILRQAQDEVAFSAGLKA